ncbi:DJ-1/PfpI family protein [Brevundimonas sp. SORGH_AS_0993]|uniref:DJ-1/PfpI family protein n=1 Tax=Brevundimonas sp. SORGH_AS_0993 TaxID=3041794 RepID=UPI00277E5339|nr:DJ-1/PfpI family protein [Brevundimonas sp. SORGH_AS_0993]MDQ1154733.1 putative intracellular protease/amidase [Brevundimonas sp. SORGH_AS_0993]
MTAIVTLLTPDYADWETALIMAAARSHYGFETLFAAPDGEEVVSAGGLLVVPNLSIDDIDVEDVDAILVNGGSIWREPNAPDVSDLLRQAHGAGKTVGGICDGTLALARAGLLDHVAHTANGPDSLSVVGYGGGAHYRDQPQAVLADRIVTAPGTAPVSFMGAVLASLGLKSAELDAYLRLFGAEHSPRVSAA